MTEGELADEDSDYLDWDDSEFEQWWEEEMNDEDALYDWDDYKESYLDEYNEHDYDLFGEDDEYLDWDEDDFWAEWLDGDEGDFWDDEPPEYAPPSDSSSMTPEQMISWEEYLEHQRLQDDPDFDSQAFFQQQHQQAVLAQDRLQREKENKALASTTMIGLGLVAIAGAVFWMRKQC